MTTTIPEETGTAAAPKKARVAPRSAHIAPAKAKPGKKARPAKSAKRGGSARDGSKTAKILDLLRRTGGATSKELLKVTGWQAHSVRGFLSGTVGKKMGLNVVSTKGEDGGRVYSIK